jgi:hypothetical protein
VHDGLMQHRHYYDYSHSDYCCYLLRLISSPPFFTLFSPLRIEPNYKLVGDRGDFIAHEHWAPPTLLVPAPPFFGVAPIPRVKPHFSKGFTQPEVFGSRFLRSSATINHFEVCLHLLFHFEQSSFSASDTSDTSDTRASPQSSTFIFNPMEDHPN